MNRRYQWDDINVGFLVAAAFFVGLMLGPC